MNTRTIPIKQRPGTEKGQGFVEYALLIFLVGAILALILALTGVTLRELYCQIVGMVGGQACVFTPTEWLRIQGNWDIGDEICGGTGEGRIFADGFSGEDYTIHIDSTTLSQGNGYGVFFRATDPSRVNGYTFQYDPGYGGGAFIFRKWVNGNELSNPIAVSRAPGYTWHNRPHSVQVAVNGDHFTAYVDGVPVLEATDGTYPSGGAGLRTWDNTRMCARGISIKEQ